MTTNSNEKKLTKSDFKKAFFRSCTLDSGWDYERQQHLNFCFTMVPILKRLYSDDQEKMKRALTRHMEFMACTPHIVTLLVGIVAAMEEENANNEDFDESSITAVKTSLMGPMAGVGDSFFWGTLLTIAVGIGTSFATQGSIIGPIIFFLIINVPGFLSRYYGLEYGYKLGSKFFSDNKSQALIANVTKAASILGLMVIGSMVASQVYVDLAIMVGSGELATPLSEYISWIMPGFLPLCTFGIMYYLLSKDVKSTKILLFVIILSCLGCLVNIF